MVIAKKEKLYNHWLTLTNVRRKNIKRLLLNTVCGVVIAIAILFSGCVNMPTPPGQITGSYTSGLIYENYDCSQLAIELNALARRENQLVVAQEQRIKSSHVQAFWLSSETGVGYGKGDGIEASELANVRGEKEAVRRAREIKHCEIPK